MRENFKTGLASELKAASYYAKLGYEIFWPMQTQSRCDFLILKDHKYQKVQVKTATWSKTGPYLYLQARISTRNKDCKPLYSKGDFDIIFFIEEGGRMWSMPFEIIEGKTSVCLASTNTKPRNNIKDYNPEDWEILKD